MLPVGGDIVPTKPRSLFRKNNRNREASRERYLFSIERLYDVDIAFIAEFKQDDFAFVFESRSPSYIQPPPVTDDH